MLSSLRLDVHFTSLSSIVPCACHLGRVLGNSYVQYSVTASASTLFTSLDLTRRNRKKRTKYKPNKAFWKSVLFLSFFSQLNSTRSLFLITHSLRNTHSVLLVHLTNTARLFCETHKNSTQTQTQTNKQTKPLNLET